MKVYGGRIDQLNEQAPAVRAAVRIVCIYKREPNFWYLSIMLGGAALSTVIRR